MGTPTPREQLQIALRACKSPKTVARAYKPLRVHETTRESICVAARELGYQEPPPPAEPEPQR